MANRREFLARFLQTFLLFLFPEKIFAQIIPFAFFKKYTPPVTLWGWAANATGVLGDGTTTDVAAPK